MTLKKGDFVLTARFKAGINGIAAVAVEEVAAVSSGAFVHVHGRFGITAQPLDGILAVGSRDEMVAAAPHVTLGEPA